MLHLVSGPHRRRLSVPQTLLGVAFCIIVVGPIVYRLYQFASPITPREIYEQGLKSLAAEELGKVQLATELLQATDATPQYREVLQGGINLRLGRLHQAAAVLEPAMRNPETAALAHTLTGEALYKNRQFGAAIDVLREAIKLDETSVDAHRWLAAAYYDIGATGPTIKTLAVVAKLVATDPRPHRLTGLIYKDMESYDAAIVEYREALSRSADFADRDTVLKELAECLVKSGKHDEVDAVLALCPLDAVTLGFAAESQHASGNSTEALKLVDQALAMSPQDLPALLLKASLQAENGQIDEALGTLNQAVAAYPLDNRVHYQLSQFYFRQGNTQAGDKHATEASRLRDLRAHFTDLHAQASENLGNAEVRYQLGITANQLGLTELAISWLSATLAIDPNHSLATAELRKLTNPAFPPRSEPDGNTEAKPAEPPSTPNEQADHGDPSAE